MVHVNFFLDMYHYYGYNNSVLNKNKASRLGATNQEAHPLRVDAKDVALQPSVSKAITDHSFEGTPQSQSRLVSCDECPRPAAVGFDDFIDFGHQTDSFV